PLPGPMDHERHCPDPELLAAYLDAGLDPAAREAVVHHLAECDRCRRLLAEIVRVQDDVPAMRPEPVPPGAPPSAFEGHRRLVRAAWGVVGLALAALLGVTAWTLRQAPETSQARLASAAGDERTVEARLSGPFPYAPLRS